MIIKLLRSLRNNQSAKLITILVIISIFISFSNYFRIPIAGISDFIKYSIHFVILTSSIIGVLVLSTTFRWSTLIIFTPLLIISLFSATSLYFFNITITSEILEVTLKTDWSVSKEFISPQLILLFVILITGVTILVWYRLKTGRLRIKSNIIIIITCLFMIIPSVILNSKRQNTIINRVPFSIINAAKEYKLAIDMSQKKRLKIANDAYYSGKDSLNVILILGESLRNDHLGFNGYKRNTTPLLSKQDIYTFKKNKSLLTYTAASVPQILTRADSNNPEKAFSEESVLSIFKNAGFNTVWLANQVPDYTYASIAKNCDKYINLSANSNTYSDIISTDQNILNTLDHYLNEERSAQKLLVLHTIGSHWYYNYRCPEKLRKFTPITQSRSFSNNSKEEMINSYDNSVYFTDYFVNEVILKNKEKKTIVIYVSDHGESLGEDNKWLHAFEHPTLHNAACFIWMSERYKRKHKFEEALIKNTYKKTNTSAIFHTLLHAADIKTNILDQSESLLSSKYSSENKHQ